MTSLHSLPAVAITRRASRVRITDRRAVRIATLVARGLNEREATITVDLAAVEADDWDDNPLLMGTPECSGCGVPVTTGSACAACLADDALWRVPMEGQ